MRVFIFGIGGTGSRVLRSLTMLLASGLKFKNDNVSIVPIIIDTDAHNGDTTRTRDLLRDYNLIRKTFVNRNNNSNSDSFFNTEIRSFSHLNPQDEAENNDLDIQLNFQNQDSSFANFINLNGLSQSNKDLMELLFNDSLDDHPELYLNLSVGFKGNPNIGSVVFNDLKSSQQFQNLQNGFTANDRIFIISSIFGGTGASGFPTLVKLLRTSTNGNLTTAKIGAITVMPYFNVEANESSAINSAMFDTKTKAALSFYANDIHICSVNALYYIADNNLEGCLPNIEGGPEQINNGHLIEFIASTAIVDFINKEDVELDGTFSFEFGAEHNAIPFNISHFTPTSKQKYLSSLVKFAYASKIATNFIPTLTQSAFYSANELNITGSLGIPTQYNKLLNFFNEFKKWTSVEMNSPTNGRAFNSFIFDKSDNLNNLVIGREISTGPFDKGLSKRKVSEILNRYETSRDLKDKPIPERYLSMLFKTSSDCLKDLGQLP